MEPTTKRGIVPLAAAYVTFGMFWGSVAVIMSDLLAHNGMSAGRIGTYFTVTAITAVSTMAWVAPRVAHLPRRWTIAASLGIHAFGAFLMAVLTGTTLLLAFVAIGLGTGLVDVLINATGNESEQRTGRATLQWVHMSYSLGAAGGAIISGVILTNGGGFGLALAVMGTVQLAAVLVVIASPMLRAQPPRLPSESSFSLSAFRRWPALLVPALIVCAAFFAEGSMDVWSGSYLQESMDATVLQAAFGFAAFAAANAMGRGMAGILFKVGYRRIVIFSGAGSLAAGLVAVLASSVTVVSIAYLVLGFCLSSAAPAAFGSVEAETGHDAGLAIAAVTTVGYAGFVFAPPFMGWLADTTGGFGATMAVLTLTTAGVLVGGLLTKKEPGLVAERTEGEEVPP